MKRVLNNKMIKGIVGLGYIIGFCMVLNVISSNMMSDTITTNELHHQVKSVEELRDNFSEFNVIDSENNNLYVITLNDNVTISYEVECDMFYVNDSGNIEEFEAIEDAQKYVNEMFKNKYNDYKNSLITQYGEDTYNLMNQETGISSERESFIHYIKYGI